MAGEASPSRACWSGYRPWQARCSSAYCTLPLPPDLRQASPYWLFSLLLVGYSIPGMWLFNRTRGSVPVAILYHWAMNMSVLLLIGAPREMIVWLVPVAWIITAAAVLAGVGPGLQYDRYETDESGAALAATIGRM